MSIETAMQLTGHKSLQTVLQHYREVPYSDLEEAVAALGGETLGLLRHQTRDRSSFRLSWPSYPASPRGWRARGDGKKPITG